MKTLFLSVAAVFALAAPASAQRAVVVDVPANVQTPEGAKAYAKALDEAVREVCSPKYGPLMGPAWDAYFECVKKTKADVAAREPTGLYRRDRKDTRMLDLAAR